MMTKMIEIDDVTFLRGIIEELDHGWTTGTMCDNTGKKCLVGAGAAVLGADYTGYADKHWLWRHGEFPWDDLAVVSDVVSTLEAGAAERLVRLLNIESEDDEIDDIDTVTTFNDMRIKTYANLRAVLVETIERIEAEKMEMAA